MDFGMMLLRLTIGFTLAAHGAQKLFGWFGGPGLEATGQFLAAIGFQPGRQHAWLVGFVEIAGGLLMAAGFLTPLAAALMVADMLVAAVSVHRKQGFFISNGGYEYTLVLGVASLTVAFAGAGALSLDALLGWSFGGAFWGTAALLVALVGGAIPLAARHALPAVHA